MDVSWSPVDPRVGQTVIFSVKLVDQDAPSSRVTRANVGDGSSRNAYACTLAKRPDPHGRWRTPAPTYGASTETIAHIYERAGTFEVRLYARSWHGESFCGFGEYGNVTSPYASFAFRTILLTVSPAPSPSPSSSPIIPLPRHSP